MTNPDLFYTLAANAPEVPEWFEKRFEKPESPYELESHAFLPTEEAEQFQRHDRFLAEYPEKMKEMIEHDYHRERRHEVFMSWKSLLDKAQNLQQQARDDYDKSIMQLQETVYFAWRKYFAEKIMEMNGK